MTAQVVGDGFCCYNVYTFVARVRRATASRAGTVRFLPVVCETRMPVPRAAVTVRAMLGLDTYGTLRGPILALLRRTAPAVVRMNVTLYASRRSLLLPSGTGSRFGVRGELV